MLKKLLLCVLGLVMSVSMVFAAVNVNTASQKELEALPGIGVTRAKAIVDYRKKNGDFKSIDDVQKVDGIGPKTLADIKGQIVLTGADAKAKDDKKADKKAAGKAIKEDKPVAKEVKAEVKEAKAEVKAEAKKDTKEVKSTEKKAEKAVEKAADKPVEKAKK